MSLEETINQYKERSINPYFEKEDREEFQNIANWLEELKELRLSQGKVNDFWFNKGKSEAIKEQRNMLKAVQIAIDSFGGHMARYSVVIDEILEEDLKEQENE